MFTLSCQKQTAPEIVSDQIKTSAELKRLDACSRVNFSKGVILYKNVLDLFVCTKWNEQFPHMYESMQHIEAANWDHLMAPVDHAFIENQQKRDRVFRNIHDLDSKGGLNDLSYVITALNETNFFDSMKALFACAEPGHDQTDPICANRSGRIPEKKSLKNIIKLVDIAPENIDNASQFVKLFVTALNGHQEELRDEINKFRASPLYVPLRLKMMDAIASKVKVGLTDEDRNFPGKILLTGNKNGDTPWIYQWIQDVKLGKEKFRDLLEYPVLTNPEFVSEIKNLKKAYDGGVSCSVKSTNDPNDLIEFDFKTHLSEYVGVIRNRTYKDFYDYSSADIVGLKMSTEVCRELESNRYNVNFIKVLSHFSDFVGEKKFYDLVRFLVHNSTAKGDLDKTFAENLYLFDMIAGDIFSSANNLNSNIIASTRNFYPLVFDVVKDLPAEAYANLGEFFQAVGKESNDAKFKGIADVWNFFTPEEKNFLFNFVDRHFDKNVKYVLLFDFYTKFLDDFRDVQPQLKDAWMGTDSKEEASYLAMQDLFTNFAGRETLQDFKKFFSRDQIIKVLEVISNGAAINKNAKEEIQYIYSDNYVTRSRSEKYKFTVPYDHDEISNYNAKDVIECMKKFSDIHNGFYEMVRNLPAACANVKEGNMAFRFHAWLNAINESFESFKKPSSSKDSLFDEKGILSPYMVNTTLGLGKILDNLVGPLNSNVPTKNGLSYLLSSFNYYLNQKQAAPLVEKNLDWLNSFLNVSPENNVQHRNALIKSLSKEENFSNSRSLFNNTGILLSEYGNWIKTGELARAQTRSLGTYDPKNDCANVINQHVSPNPCPSKDVVKKYGNDILYLMQNVWEKEQGSPVALLLKAAKTGDGIEIPYRGKNTRKVRMSLRDTFRYFYDTSDKSLPINNTIVTFVNENNISSRETVTTLERIESVIREVRFKNNYLGVSYLNKVVFGDDYNADVITKKKILQKCVKIPYVRCGRKMDDSDLRMALNSLEVYDGLLDANNGRGLEPRFQFGDYLKTFQTLLVGSSPIEAQKVKFFPLNDKVLEHHNGKVLGDMTLMTTWSNAGRVIRDRVGRTRSEFEAFINREDFKRVDRAMLYGFDLPTATPSAERLINKLQSVPSGENQNLFGNTVDWISSLSYEQTRLLEDTIARALVVGSYLGTPELVFEKSGYDSLSQKYANNNLFQIFLGLEKLVDYWPTLKNNFPGDVKLIDAIKPINTALYFLTTKLNSSSDPMKNTAYLALNDLFLALQTSVFDQMPNPQIGGNADKTTQGLDLLLEMFKDQKLVNSTYALARADYNYLDVFHQNNGEWFSTVGQNLRRMAESNRVDMTPLRDFLAFSSKNVVCLSGESVCPANYHYDEPANIVHFLNKKSDSGQSNFMIMNQKLFIENTVNLSHMIDDLLICVKIKEVKPPLSLN